LHWLGTPLADDIELYHEDDEGFRVGSSLSANERWLIVGTSDHETSEVRLIPAADPLATPLLVKARQKGVEYDVDERDGTLYIHANDTHENFRLATAPLSAPGEWTTLIEGSDAFYLTGFELYRDFYVTQGRRSGLDQVELRYYDDPARVEPIAFPEASYVAGLGDNPEWAVDTLRLSYESMVSPASVLEYDVAARRLTTLKVRKFPRATTPRFTPPSGWSLRRAMGP
jgi:oligopeptidase B